MLQDMPFEFEEIEIVKDHRMYYCYGVCNVEYEVFWAYDHRLRTVSYVQVVGYDNFKVRLTDIDGNDIDFLDCDKENPYAKLIIDQLNKDEILIEEACYNDFTQNF